MTLCGAAGAEPSPSSGHAVTEAETVERLRPWFGDDALEAARLFRNYGLAAIPHLLKYREGPL